MKKSLVTAAIILVVVLVSYVSVNIYTDESSEGLEVYEAPSFGRDVLYPENTFYTVYSDYYNYKVYVSRNVGRGGNCGWDADSGNFVGDWQCDFIDNSVMTSYGNAVSISKDSKNIPHISYTLKRVEKCDPNGPEEYSGDLGHAFFMGGGKGNCGPSNSWKCSRVELDNCRNIAQHSSIVLDSIGIPHIAYLSNKPGGGDKVGDYTLKVAHYVGSGGNCGYDRYTGDFVGDWQCDVILDSLLYVYSYISLAIDSNDKLHLVFNRISDAAVLYAEQVGSGGNCGAGSWKCSLINKDPYRTSIVGPRSIVVSDLGEVMVSASRSDKLTKTEHVVYYRYVGSGGNCGEDLNGDFVGDWQCETVDDRKLSGDFTSMALDENGNPHIFYFKNEAAPPWRLWHAKFVGSGAGNCVNKDWDCEFVHQSSGNSMGAYLYQGQYPFSLHGDSKGGVMNNNPTFVMRGDFGWNRQIIDKNVRSIHTDVVAMD